MKQKSYLHYYLVIFMALPAVCYGELWQGAKSLPKSGSSFGLHTQLYQVSNSQSAKFMTFSQFDYGKSDQLQLETRLGFRLCERGKGGFRQFKLLPRRPGQIPNSRRCELGSRSHGRPSASKLFLTYW